MKQVSVRGNDGKKQVMYLISKSEMDDILDKHENKIMSKVRWVVDAKIRKYTESFVLGSNKIILAKRPDKSKETKMLLKNYRKLKGNIEKTLLDRCRREKVYYESFEWFDKMMRNKDPDRIMECVVEESYKTAVLLCRIEYAIERYQKLALQAADKTAAVRCNALIDLYIADEKIKVAEISEKLMLKKSQVYNYIGAAIEEVAALLFPDEEQDTTITENENT